MNCREVLGRLYDYLDKEIGEEEQKHLEQHLDCCSECLKKYQLEEEFNRLIKEKIPSQPDLTALRNKIKLEIDKIDGQSQPRNIIFLLGPLVVAAVIALVIFIPSGRGSDPQAVLKAVRPYADAHSKCLEHLTSYLVQSTDPAVVRDAMSHLADLPDDLFTPSTPDITIEGATISHFANEEDPHVDFKAFGQYVSIFVLAANTIDKTPFHKIEHNGETLYVGSCPLYQYVIWECEEHECVAVSKLPQQDMISFASRF